MRQEVRGLIEKVDAQLIIGNPDMDVQAADRQPPTNGLQIIVQTRIAAALGSFLRIRAGKWMRPGGDRRQTAPRRHPGDGRPQPSQIDAGLAEARTNPCSDLDLRSQKFRAYLPCEQYLALLQHFRRGIADDIARRAVDEKIFLLDSKSEFR